MGPTGAGNAGVGRPEPPCLPPWRAARTSGADLLWRVKSNAVLPLCRQLEDGSYLSQTFAAEDYYQCHDPEHVRAIEYTLEGSTGSTG
ncbi:hypothetical protein [Streptomyces sp. CT34]|uniref:hypothetical protein n=1 Tax=Streptomyces sp. CT34 TaxID=1553907 RepID=UPI000AFABA9E|nr:hypothetical protein [Streptomyces sp. CT34]